MQTDSLDQETKLQYFDKYPFCHTFKEMILFCKKDKRKALKLQATGHLEYQLDVRSLVNVSTNLSLLFQLLFNEKQMVMFWYQHSRREALINKKVKQELNLSMNEDTRVRKKVFAGLQKPRLAPKVNSQELSLQRLLGYKIATELDRKLI